jgi:hypothetical protein
MRQQNRDGQPTQPAPKPLDAFLARAFRIGVAFVTSMPMNYPGTTTRTNRTQSFALFAADLDAEQNPNSSRLIKSRSFGLHDAFLLLFTPPVRTRLHDLFCSGTRLKPLLKPANHSKTLEFPESLLGS